MLLSRPIKMRMGGFYIQLEITYAAWIYVSLIHDVDVMCGVAVRFVFEVSTLTVLPYLRTKSDRGKHTICRCT